MRTIDLNSDLGEGMSNDEAVMQQISSANIACGFHAGDVHTMKQTVAWALKYKVAVGAHPSYPDRQNFGRIDMLGAPLSLYQVEACIHEQMDAMFEVCSSLDCSMQHVKPHGALYNRASADIILAECIAKIIAGYDQHLMLYGLSGSEMAKAAQKFGLKFMHEVFADRGYADDGSLLPRSAPGALLNSPDQAITQVLQMVCEGKVRTNSGKTISILADTICVHGDGPHALDIVNGIHEQFAQYQIQIGVAKS